jgi:hypothetical protein
MAVKILKRRIKEQCLIGQYQPEFFLGIESQKYLLAGKPGLAG